MNDVIVRGRYKLFTITPAVQATPDYAAGDVLFAPTEVSGLFTDAGASCILKSVTIIDKQIVSTHSFTLYFTYSSTAFGTINATAGVSIGTLEEIQAAIRVRDADWIAGGGAGSVDLANVCTISNPAIDGIGAVLQGVNSAGSAMSKGIYVVGVANEAMNVASTSDLIIKIGVEY